MGLHTTPRKINGIATIESKFLPSYSSDFTVNVDCETNNSSSELLSQRLSAIVQTIMTCLSETAVFVEQYANCIYLDKQTVNNSLLVAFFTRTCHVMLIKTIAYVTVTLNKTFLNVMNSLIYFFPQKYKRAKTLGDIIAGRKQWVWMTIGNCNT